EVWCSKVVSPTSAPATKATSTAASKVPSRSARPSEKAGGEVTDPTLDTRRRRGDKRPAKRLAGSRRGCSATARGGAGLLGALRFPAARPQTRLPGKRGAGS